MSLFTVTTSCLCEMESNRVLGPLPVGLLLCLAVEKSRRFSLNPTKLIQFILYSVKTNCTSHLLFSFRHLLQNTPWMSSENQKKKKKKTKARRFGRQSIWCCCRNYLSQLCISVCEKFISQCYGSNAPNSCIACMLTKENGFSPQTAMNSCWPTEQLSLSLTVVYMYTIERESKAIGRILA